MRANDPPDDSSGPTEKELAAAKDAALQCLALHRYCYGKCWTLTSHLKSKKITVTDFITQVDSFCKDLGLQWQRCALVLTDGVEELILKRNGTLIEIGKRKFATAHEAVVGMAISLGGSILASHKLFKPKAAKNAIEKMELALVAQKIDWDGLKAEIKVEFGRAVAGLQPATLSGPDDLPADGQWLMPPVALAVLANRLDNITPEKAKTILLPHRLRKYPKSNRQSWSVDLSKMQLSMREKIEAKNLSK